LRVRNPGRGPRLELVIRWSPRLTVFVREEPVTRVRPSRAQAHCRLRFAELSKASKHFTHEEVAELVGGEVVEVNGRKAIRMPDGRLLQKHLAFIKAMMTGFKSPYTRVSMPKWLRTVSRNWFTAPGITYKRYKALKETIKTVVSKK